MNKTIENLKKKRKDIKINIDSRRGHKKHIRITRNFSINELKEIKDLTVLSQEKNESYSRSYSTLMVEYKDEVCPIIISCDNNSLNSSVSILQKQLTPEKLNITGEFNDANTLKNNIIEGLKNITPKPKLNENAKKVIDDPNEDKLINLLIKLTKQVINPKILLTEEDVKIYKICQTAIEKDFGELLNSLHLLNKKNIKKVFFTKTEANQSYDLKMEDHNGFIFKINIKSGSGSGQSFKGFSKYQIDSLLNDGNFSPTSDLKKYALLIKNLNDKDTKGIDKILNSANLLKETSDDIAVLLKDLLNEFFMGNSFSFDKLKCTHISFSQYEEILLKILTKNNKKIIGIPKGNKRSNLEDYFKEEKALKNALLFTISTWTMHFTDNNKINSLIKKMVNHIIISQINFNGKRIHFTMPKNINYALHYWGNLKAPTNNMIGYKTLI